MGAEPVRSILFAHARPRRCRPPTALREGSRCVRFQHHPLRGAARADLVPA